MELFYSKGSCSLVVRIIINELQLSCNYTAVNLKDKTTQTNENFLSINDKGAVPTLRLENGKIITENQVILQYLVDSYQGSHLCPPAPHWQHYQILQWLNYMTTELHKSFGNLFNPSIPEDLKKQVFIPLIEKKFAYINRHLEGHYLLGEDFTLPDAYLFVMILWAKKFELNLGSLTNLTRYFEQLKQRPSIAQSLEEEGL